MPFATPLFYNVTTGQLVYSVAQPSPVNPPIWIFGDTKHILLTFVQNTDTAGIVSIVPATGIGLQVAAGVPGGAVYTSVTSPNAVADVFTFDLPMNTNAINTAFAGGVQINCTLEFRTTSGGFSQRYEIPLTILQHVISDTLIDTPAPDTAIGVAAANASFAKKDQPAGDFLIWRSLDGTRKAQIYLGNDMTIHADEIT